MHFTTKDKRFLKKHEVLGEIVSLPYLVGAKDLLSIAGKTSLHSTVVTVTCLPHKSVKPPLLSAVNLTLPLLPHVLVLT